MGAGKLGAKIGLLTAALALAATASGCAMSADQNGESDDALANAPPYLALGDSVAFGDNPLIAHDGQHNDQFVGYPTDVGGALKLKTVSLACAGETSGSFLDLSARDNGCKTNKSSGTLHVRYESAQVEEAVGYLKAHPDTKLVTIGIGANDLLLVKHDCNSGGFCEAEHVPGTLIAFHSHMKSIFHALRDDAGYQGEIVAVKYYIDDYKSFIGKVAMSSLNDVLAEEAGDVGAKVADGYGAMRQAAADAGFPNDPCAAGLLIRMPDNTCNIHPSPAGRKVLAQAVMAAVDSN
jgi:hypothetical protein